MSYYVNESPFEAIERSLVWWLFESHPEVVRIVKPRNIVKNTDGPQPQRKDNLNPADLPEVRLVPVAGDPEKRRTSSSGSFVQAFNIEVLTGDQRTGSSKPAIKLVSDLKWAIVQAWHQIRGGIPELEYARIVRLETANDQLIEDDGDRVAKGWSYVCGITVEITYPTHEVAI